GRITAMARWPTAATYLTERATSHLAASLAAATPQLTSVYKQQPRLHLPATATPHRTVITDRPATSGGRSKNVLAHADEVIELSWHEAGFPRAHAPGWGHFFTWVSRWLGSGGSEAFGAFFPGA